MDGLLSVPETLRKPKCCRHDTTGKTPAVFQKRVKPSLQK
jgi:hypothetical protein